MGRSVLPAASAAIAHRYASLNMPIIPTMGGSAVSIWVFIDAVSSMSPIAVKVS